MTIVVRFLAALVVGLVVAVVGALILGDVETGSPAWLALMLLAGFAASLVDRETFYGPKPPHTRD